VVWHKAEQIDLVSPGRGAVSASFELSETPSAEIRAATLGGEKHLASFDVEILGTASEVVAHVGRVVHVRRRREAGAN
jgi:hypothetical protein